METKHKLTSEELSAVRSAAGRKGGSAPKNGRHKVARAQLQVRRADRDVLMSYSAKKRMTMIDAVHFLMRVVLQNNPDISKPKDWID